MHHNLLLAWLAAFLFYFLLHLKRQPIKPIANYDASIILVMYYKIVYLLNLLCMLEFYTALPVYLFFLASQWFHTFKSFSNLYFLGLAFFFTSDMFWSRSLLFQSFILRLYLLYGHMLFLNIATDYMTLHVRWVHPGK